MTSTVNSGRLSVEKERTNHMPSYIKKNDMLLMICYKNVSILHWLLSELHEQIHKPIKNGLFKKYVVWNVVKSNVINHKNIFKKS